jgi:hypothetical protein
MITLKNVKFSEHMSEETNAFTCDVYFNGKKTGYAKNDGHGGCTFTHFYPNMREQGRAMEIFAQSLPPVVYGEHSFPSDLESVVDHQFEAWLKLSELKKNFNKGIVFEEGNGHSIIKYPISINKMKQNMKGIQALKTTIARLKLEGKTIVNTNLQGFL